MPDLWALAALGLMTLAYFGAFLWFGVATIVRNKLLDSRGVEAPGRVVERWTTVDGPANDRRATAWIRVRYVTASGTELVQKLRDRPKQRYPDDVPVRYDPASPHRMRIADTPYDYTWPYGLLAFLSILGLIALYNAITFFQP